MLESSQLSAALYSRIRSVHALKQHTQANYKGPSQFWGTRDFFFIVFTLAFGSGKKTLKNHSGPRTWRSDPLFG